MPWGDCRGPWWAQNQDNTNQNQDYGSGFRGFGRRFGFGKPRRFVRPGYGTGFGFWMANQAINQQQTTSLEAHKRELEKEIDELQKELESIRKRLKQQSTEE